MASFSVRQRKDEYLILSWFNTLPMLYLRLEEKLSDMETEDQILRQQTLLNSNSKRLSGHLSFSGSQVYKSKC